MRTFLLPVGLSAIAPSTLSTQTAAENPASTTPAISGMRAHLFQNKKGEWSEDILAPQCGGLWNSIAGPNAANATLVIVEVSGAAERHVYRLLRLRDEVQSPSGRERRWPEVAARKRKRQETKGSGTGGQPRLS